MRPLIYTPSYEDAYIIISKLAIEIYKNNIYVFNMINTINVLLLFFWEIIKAVPKIVLAVFPLYQQLSGFKQDLIATALGISPIVFLAIVFVFKLVKIFINDSK